MAPSAKVIPRARAAAQRALSLDPNQVEALATLANIASAFDWDMPTSISLTDRALAIDPLHVRAIVERAFVNAYRRTASESVQQQALRDLEKAVTIDPLNAWAAAMRGWSLSSVGRYDDGIAETRRAIELDPAGFTGRWGLVWTLAAAGRDAEALDAAEPALQMSGRSPRILAEVAAAHARLGNRDAAEQIFQEVTERARTTYVGSSEQAAIAASAGRLELARELLKRGIEARESYVVFESCPAWGPLRMDEAGRTLLDSAGP